MGTTGDNMDQQHPPAQPHQEDPEAERSLLAELLESSRLYQTGEDYLELLDFTSRLRNFAPFNAMLLQVQKPGLTYATSAWDWRMLWAVRRSDAKKSRSDYQIWINSEHAPNVWTSMSCSRSPGKWRPPWASPPIPCSSRGPSGVRAHPRRPSTHPNT